MSLNIPMIVIPNPVLQDNHQLELAEELQRQRYALHGDLAYVQPLSHPRFLAFRETLLTPEVIYPNP